MPASGALSWSPDENRLAVVIERGGLPQQVAVLDLRTRDVQAVGEGYAPAWSPAGEWIAYYAREKCVLVHPDGTGTKTVKSVSRRFLLEGYRSF